MTALKILLLLVIVIISSALAAKSDDYNLVSVRQCTCTVKKFPRQIAKELEEQARENAETIVIKDPETDIVSPYKSPPRQKRSSACPTAFSYRTGTGRMVSIRKC